ncbi:unnamed protein product [Ambrosiozyma monospora]|uniref:Unnamed protein product n=1 Tax=Ambrosiozyma monospora TaxID=43982 RepID=A0ACB5UDB1_AMBMO|nr:unnamed protein product [Ambrosiozyma monospora]
MVPIIKHPVPETSPGNITLNFELQEEFQAARKQCALQQQHAFQQIIDEFIIDEEAPLTSQQTHQLLDQQQQTLPSSEVQSHIQLSPPSQQQQQQELLLGHTPPLGSNNVNEEAAVPEQH